MRKLLLLGSLLATISGQAQETAQTTYYWPGERVTTLQSGTQYFIYNTARSSDNYPYRSFFLYSDGNWLKSNNQIPTEFITTEKEHIFTLEQPASPSAESHWYIKSIHGNVGIAGQTNNTETVIFISHIGLQQMRISVKQRQVYQVLMKPEIHKILTKLTQRLG